MEEGRWYHGSLSRLEAEAVLEKDGFDEGLFLVRESSSATGDFVLSIVHDKEVIHYQIRRRGEDALFSLSEEQKVIHGLDELIFYYQNQMHSGLQHRLSRYLPKDECPTSVKLHGVQNLLHRATAAGSDKVVSELLQCGGRDLTAKNHDGQCAVHLAAFYGHVEVLAKLIDYGANVNVADSSGYSPLHVACQSNKAETVRLLLEARANPTTRNQITSWVPLHEAAWKGHMACAQVLLDVGDAPVMSRTDKDETPADLARANGANDMSDKLNDWPSFQSFSNREDWLHPDTLGRVAAVEMLRQRPDNGTFLLRGSQKKRKTFVLSMCYESAFYHFVIETRGIYVFLDAGPYMPSLEHLVDHYTRYPDGLPWVLKSPLASGSSKPQLEAPCPPRDMPKPLADLDVSPDLPPRVKQRERNLSHPTNLRPIDRRKMYENNDTLRRVRHSKDNIPSESIRMIEAIGEGEFGSVFKGLYMSENDPVRAVAVKVLNEFNESQSQDFLREANVMMNLDHQSIVQLIGVSSGSRPVLMVLELVPLGSMLDYLKENSASVRADMEIPLWAAQIACGMVYLEQQRFIHRDLAARNILLASKLQAKISDFGLSRIISEEKDYYQASQGGRWPIKWYAPESVNYGTFSHASDVWSFGVLLWEMYTFGLPPYEGMTGAEVIKYIEAGKRLPRPQMAELGVYSVITWCWEKEPVNRPSFSELFKTFAENPEYTNVKELLLTQSLDKLENP